jgi:hypothetical protein
VAPGSAFGLEVRFPARATLKTLDENLSIISFSDLLADDLPEEQTQFL